MRFWRFSLVSSGFLLFLFVSTSLLAQDSEKMTYAGLKTSKFDNLPVLPTCAKAAVQRGDPSKGAATLAGKLTPGCRIPWHWHTYGENLVLVSGSAKVEMKEGGTSHALSPGDYAFMPGKQTHQFTCPTACVLYIMPEGAFDIHYVDKDGKEIPLDQAVKSTPKKAPAKKPAS